MELILEAIYDAALRPGGWPEAMERIGEMLGASSAFLFSTHSDVEPGAVLQVHNHSPEMLDGFVRYWHTQDEWAMAARRKGFMRAGTVVLGRKLISRPDLQKTAFYNDFTRHHGIADMVGSVVFDGSEPGGMPFTNLCWYRPPGAEPFDDSHSILIAKLLPHVQRALRLQRQLHCLADQRVDEALGGLGLAKVVLDGQGVIVDCNSEGEALLRRQGAVRHQRLRSLGERCTPLILEAIQRCGAGVPVQITCWIEGDPPFVLCATLMRLPVESVTLIGAHSLERFLLMARMPRQRGAELAAAVGPLFGLSAAESRVLGALIDGRDAAQIAALSGTALGTVRTQIRNLLGKAGVGSQAELLRMLQGMR